MADNTTQGIPADEPIKFGTWNNTDLLWDVLWEDDYKKLLLCRTAPASYSMYNQIWHSSDNRKYLNNGFYDNAFSDSEKVRIVNACIMENGYKTKDNVFLLSYDEMYKYIKTKHFQDRNNNYMLTRTKSGAYSYFFYGVQNSSTTSSNVNNFPCIYLKK